MSGVEHEAIVPSNKIVSSVKKKVEPKASRKGEPSFFMTDEMRRLSTPWSIASIRANQIDLRSCLLYTSDAADE